MNDKIQFGKMNGVCSLEDVNVGMRARTTKLGIEPERKGER